MGRGQARPTHRKRTLRLVPVIRRYETPEPLTCPTARHQLWSRYPSNCPMTTHPLFPAMTQGILLNPRHQNAWSPTLERAVSGEAWN